MEIYGVHEKIILGEASAEPNMIFFKDPHIFPYYPSKCLHNEFILTRILQVYQLRKTKAWFLHSKMNISFRAVLSHNVKFHVRSPGKD